MKKDSLKSSNNENVNEQKSTSSKIRTVFDPVYESKYEKINIDMKNSAQTDEEVNKKNK